MCVCVCVCACVFVCVLSERPSSYLCMCMCFWRGGWGGSSLYKQDCILQKRPIFLRIFKEPMKGRKILAMYIYRERERERERV